MERRNRTLVSKAIAPVCQGPDLATRRPALVVPPGAWDCHAHVFGLANRYQFRPHRRYTPAAAGVDAYAQMLTTLGLSHAVVVQPDIYLDNQATIDALRHAGGAWRGIARLYPETDDEELSHLAGLGFRGVRVDGRNELTGLADIETVAARIAPFGWHIQIHLFARDLPRIADRLARLPVPVVFDHFARPNTAGGTGQDGFRVLLDLLDGGNTWVKLSAAGRSTDAPLPYAPILPFAHALVDRAPEHLLWGSDWPHTSHDGAMPNDGDLLDLLAQWAPDAAVRDAILRTNPARLYGSDIPKE
jgi:predicted TIM-barrel fold metal-dependent hydrolase